MRVATFFPFKKGGEQTARRFRCWCSPPSPPTAAGPLGQRFSGRLARSFPLVPALKNEWRDPGFPTPQAPESLSLSGF